MKEVSGGYVIGRTYFDTKEAAEQHLLKQEIREKVLYATHNMEVPNAIEYTLSHITAEYKLEKRK